MTNVSAMSWREQVTFDEVIIISALYRLAHLNNSPRVDMLLHSNTLSWSRGNQSLLFLL